LPASAASSASDSSTPWVNRASWLNFTRIETPALLLRYACCTVVSLQLKVIPKTEHLVNAARSPAVAHHSRFALNKHGILTGRAGASREIFFRSPFPPRGASANEEKIA
jgi:hypothetical protein